MSFSKFTEAEGQLIREKFAEFNEMYKKEGLKFIIPPLAGFATVIGTALCG